MEQTQPWQTPHLTTLDVSLDTAAIKVGSGADGANHTYPVV